MAFTKAQIETKNRLGKNGYFIVAMHYRASENSAHLLLMNNADHSELLRINPDGTWTDLLVFAP